MQLLNNNNNNDLPAYISNLYTGPTTRDVPRNILRRDAERELPGAVRRLGHPLLQAPLPSRREGLPPRGDVSHHFFFEGYI